MKRDIKILAIETSCDETAASVIGEENGKPIVLSNIVSSQIDLHTKTGGVVPEVASRAHMESITPVITQALLQASNELQVASNEDSQNSKLETSDYQKAINYLHSDITHIAVTAGPGLVGSLLVGFNAAKAMAYALDLPIIPINHIEGHIYSAFGGEIRNPKSEILNKSQNQNSKIQNNLTIEQFNNEPEFPVLALTVSGGHTSLTLMKDHGNYQNIGQTLDDAAGEAFDKVAKLLDLGYPGGPIVSKLASEHRDRIKNQELRIKQAGEHSVLSDDNLAIEQYNKKIVFPRPILNDGTFNFSFSGLKTAVLVKVKELTKNGELTLDQKKEICAAFEDAAVDVLVTKTIRAVEKYKPETVILAGGVAANSLLRRELESRIKNLESGVKFISAPMNLTGDNAVMIGLAGYYHIKKGNISSWDKIHVDSNLELK